MGNDEDTKISPLAPLISDCERHHTTVGLQRPRMPTAREVREQVETIGLDVLGNKYQAGPMRCSTEQFAAKAQPGDVRYWLLVADLVKQGACESLTDYSVPALAAATACSDTGAMR